MKRNLKNRMMAVVMTAAVAASLMPVGSLASEDGFCLEIVDESGETAVVPEGPEAETVWEDSVLTGEAAGDPQGQPGEVILDMSGVAEAVAEAVPWTDTEETAGGKVSEEAEPEEGLILSDTAGDVVETADPMLASEEAAAVTSDYILMNIPYDAFYKAAGVTEKSADYDAISSATSKAGNYGKSGGAFHSGITAADGEAVGSANGAENQGVIWPVRLSGAVRELLNNGSIGWKRITDESRVATATAAHGSTTVNYLVGYETLTEAPAYSYYELAEAPDNYMELTGVSGGIPEFGAGKTAQTSGGPITPEIEYNYHWGDVKLGVNEANDALADKLINAVVITAEDGTKAGLVHLYNVWSAKDIAWRVATVKGLDGKKITNIRYYCSPKDDSTGEGNSDAPAYANYVYDYAVSGLMVKSVYTGRVTAKFDAAGSCVEVSGLPVDAENPKATVYCTEGSGKDAKEIYLTDGETAAAVTDGKIEITGIPENGKTYTVEITSDNYSFAGITASYTGSDLYMLMNIPYGVFYSQIAKVTEESTGYDAISSATNKVGNYGKSGGAFHSGASASVAADGTVTAVGGANGARNEGVIWPVKMTGELAAEIKALGGVTVTDEDKVTTATLGRGQSSSSLLVGYETLTEKPAYSCYQLSVIPDNYAELTGISGGTPVFAAGNISVKSAGTAELTAAYGSNWGDVQLKAEGTDEIADKLINAVVLTAKDNSGKETQSGLIHLSNVWSNTEMAWKADVIKGLDGKKITGIRYYCSGKDATVGADNTDAPAYVNYIYEYSVNDGEGLPVSPVYTGAVTAEFDGNSFVTVTGLPADARNLTAKVYKAGGRGEDPVYLTPLAVDPNDDDIDPVAVSVDSFGKIAVSADSVTVTNGRGESKTYGKPVDKTEYTVEISSDNYIIRKVTVVYTAPSAPETETPGTNPPETETPGTNPPETEAPGTNPSETEAPGTNGPSYEPGKEPQVNAAGLLLQTKQSTKKLKITGLAEGDSVVSWTSGNEKIVEVNQKGKITAKNKTGTTVITATLASGQTKEITVTVQKKKVATKKISGLPKKLTLKKGKTAKLEPMIAPITSQDEVTYKSLDEKIATVTAKGVIRAKKAGKVKITVTSGKKKATVTVKVKKK